MSKESLKTTKKEATPAFTFFYATSAYGPAAIMAAVAATEENTESLTLREIKTGFRQS